MSEIEHLASAAEMLKLGIRRVNQPRHGFVKYALLGLWIGSNERVDLVWFGLKPRIAERLAVMHMVCMLHCIAYKGGAPFAGPLGHFAS